MRVVVPFRFSSNAPQRKATGFWLASEQPGEDGECPGSTGVTKRNPRSGSCTWVPTVATRAGRRDQVPRSVPHPPYPSPAGQAGADMALLPGPGMARNSLSQEIFNPSSLEIRERHHPQPNCVCSESQGHYWAQHAAHRTLRAPKKGAYPRGPMPRGIDRTRGQSCPCSHALCHATLANLVTQGTSASSSATQGGRNAHPRHDRVE